MPENNDNKEDNNLSKGYSSHDTEEKWLARWLEAELFKGDNVNKDKKPNFSVVIPPPNITGTLHLGHALNNTLQDVMVRYKKMSGYNVLWIPGIDHAGIATQNVVEKQLHAEGSDRHKMGREAFIERVWKWKEESTGKIINQIKKLGSSCDWSRQRFTMDEGLSKAVKKVFVTLHKEELIYRANHIINWCPRCHTALSDIEVEAKETEGKLYHMIYPLTDGTDTLEVATTRPETMVGDTAVAVNPQDDRYKDFIGKTITLPLVNREIPIIADDYVDMEFGTGAVKITPAHDFNDFDIAKRHNLPRINVMDINAVLNEEALQYEGLDRYEARKKIVSDLKEQNLLKSVDPHKMMPGECYRCHTVVEPRLSKQWFVKVDTLAKPALDAVKKGDTRFVPKTWENLYFDWMENIRDWCISRQIWWGHRIPAFHCGDCEHITVSENDVDKCEKCNSTNVEQDPDVLDTWFSSALWPFSTLGWPDETEDLKTFYPTSTLFTSFDIIFFWVARMMMMGIKFTGEVPFKDIHIHALIRDEHGQKMSKSKGNVIDPLVMMEKYGTDTLRFTLSIMAAQGRDIKLSEDRIEGYRNFTNKLWNATRFCLMHIEERKDTTEIKNYREIKEEELSLADKWIINRLNSCIKDVTDGIDKYKLDESGKALYKFIWHELCDWYVELSKESLWGKLGDEQKETTLSVLVGVLNDTLKISHPFMPFITDEINSLLNKDSGFLLNESFPKSVDIYEEESGKMETVMDTVRAIRNVRTELNVHPKTQVKAILFAPNKQIENLLKEGENYIKTLCTVEEFEYRESGDKPQDSSFMLVDVKGTKGIEIYIPLKGIINVQEEREKHERNLGKIEKELSSLEKKLSNESFVAKAPKEVVEKEKEKLSSLKERKIKIDEAIARLENLA